MQPEESGLSQVRGPARPGVGNKSLLIEAFDPCFGFALNLPMRPTTPRDFQI